MLTGEKIIQHTTETMPVPKSPAGQRIVGRSGGGRSLWSGAEADGRRGRRQEGGKFGHVPHLLPDAGAFELNFAQGVEPPFRDPLANLFGGDWPILLLVGSDDLVHVGK